MASNSEKIAYLKGLLSGIKMDDVNEKKVFDAVLDILEGLEEKVERTEENLDNVDQHLLEVDRDLGALEELIYGDECECDDCAEDEPEEFEEAPQEELPAEDDEPDMYEVECPSCHETIYLEESVILDGNVECPNCGEELEFDVEFDD